MNEGMSGRGSLFGRLEDGSSVARARIVGDGMEFAVLSYGAVLQQIQIELPAGPRAVTLGFDNLEAYVRHSPHMGAVAGRYANRIRDGRFSIEGRICQLARNENGRTHLHGGQKGFGKRNWTIDSTDERSVTLSLISPDGEEGYPGRVEVQCIYKLAGPLRLSIELTAVSSAPTIINLATHSYFNLAGAGDARDHCLFIPCDLYLPVDADLIPTGEIDPVAGGPYDFRCLRPLRSDPPTRFDTTFVAGFEPSEMPRHMATLEAPDGSLALQVWSTEPAIQLYDGGKLAVPVSGLGGRRYGPFSGVCLEPQRFPDAPNHSGFTDTVLRPGQTYRQVTEYRFLLGGEHE
jgi:aldose 1-epimerase